MATVKNGATPAAPAVDPAENPAPPADAPPPAPVPAEGKPARVVTIADFAALETAVNERIARVEARQGAPVAPAAPPVEVDDDLNDDDLGDDAEGGGRGAFMFAVVAAVVAVLGVALWRRTRGEGT